VTFRQAVQNTQSIAHAYRPGLQALRAADKNRITANPRLLTGSVDLDSTLRATEPSSPRWDYAIGWNSASTKVEQICWLEIHPTRTTTHLNEVEQKFDWLINWLSGMGQELGKMERKFICVSSGKTGFTSTAPQLRRLASRGLQFVGGHIRLR